MKSLSKIFICILSAAIICSLVGCSSKAADDNEITSDVAGNNVGMLVHESEDITEATEPIEPVINPTEKAAENTTAPVINISEEQAKNIAYEALKKEYADAKTSVVGVDYTAFKFRFIELYSPSDDVWYNTIDSIKESGHSYYHIDFRNTNELCDIAYYYVDAFNGKVLGSGYMAD